MSDERAESCESASVSNGLALSIAIVLAASYLLSYSPRLTSSHTRRLLLAIVPTAGTLIDIVLVALYGTTSSCLPL